MALTLAVCLTPCRIATIMSLVHILIVQERQILQPVPPSVNQVGDKHIIVQLSFTLYIRLWLNL